VIRGNLLAAEAASEYPVGDHGEFVWAAREAYLAPQTRLSKSSLNCAHFGFGTI